MSTTLNKLTVGQLVCINKMIISLQLQNSKEELVLGFTNGRSSNCRELLSGEATEMIRYMKSLSHAAVKM